MVINSNMNFIPEEHASISPSIFSQASNENLEAMMIQIQMELKRREDSHRIQLTDNMISSVRNFRDEFPNEEMYMTFEVDEDEIECGEIVLPVHEVLDYIAARGWHNE